MGAFIILAFEYQLCITGISSDDDSITVNRIFRKFLARSEVWYEVGMELGLDTPTLSRISLRYQNNPDLALMEAVRQWFKKTDNPQLLDASLALEQGMNCACILSIYSHYGITLHGKTLWFLCKFLA